MAGRISWTISFDGLDAQITKLRQLDSLLNSISRKSILGGGLGGGINVGGAGGVGTVIIPSTTTGAAAGGTAAGTAAGAAAGAAIGTAGAGEVSRVRDWRRLFDPKAPWMHHDEPAKAIINFAKKMASDQAAFNIKIPKTNPSTLSQIYANRAKWARTGGAWGPLSGLSGNAPSDILKNMMGGVGSLFGSGGRLSKLGGAASAGMELIFNKLGTVLTSFMAKLLVITTIIIALHKAIRFLIDGIHKGAEVFQMAARTATPAAQHVRLKTAFAAVGLAGGELEALTALQQFNPKARGTTIPGTDEMFSALRAAQFANIQQLVNMSKQFEEAMRRSEGAARQMESSSSKNQQLALNGVIIGLKWNAMLEQLAEAMAPLIELFQRIAEVLFDNINYLLEIWNLFHRNQTGLLVPGQQRIPGMRGTEGHMGAWEKIGFNFPTPKSENSLQQIANNTNTMTIILRSIMEQGARNVMGSFLNPWNYLRSLNPFPSAP